MTSFLPPMTVYTCWGNKNVLLIILSIIYGMIHYGLMFYGMLVYNQLTYDEYLQIESQKQTKRNIKKNRKWLQ